MSRLDMEPEIIQLAHELDLNYSKEPVKRIIEFCLAQIEAWLPRTHRVCTIAELEALVCQKLQLVFEEFWSDDELETIIQKYIGQREYVFASFRGYFDESIFGTTIKRCTVAANAYDRYVALIDCRGPKAARRVFTRWHEIAHLLTTKPSKRAELFHRSTTETSPTERLMDEIAGVIGFYDPIFRPALLQHRELTFEAVDTIRSQFCPDASFQSTLIACTMRVMTPVIYIEAGMGYKKVEQEQLNSPQMPLFPSEPPQAKLRALVVRPNNSAKDTGIRINWNMEIPADSVVSTLFHKTPTITTPMVTRGRENLSIWQHSDGTSLDNVDVDIEARRLGDRVFALIRPYQIT